MVSMIPGNVGKLSRSQLRSQQRFQQSALLKVSWVEGYTPKNLSQEIATKVKHVYSNGKHNGGTIMSVLLV